MARVELEGVSKRWGSTTAVEPMSLDIADGEFLVLLGPSGCGKTTTMRMVAGLEEPSEGNIRIGGRRVNDVEPKDRDVAMVFQSYGLYPNMTVAENIGFPLKIRGIPPQQMAQAVEEAAKKVELTDFMQRRPKELSGGQRQRVALARAIVRKPSVFLMDEPLSNLDTQLRVSMRVHLKHLHRELGVTTIYVTHDQIEAMTLADRVVVMSKARIQQVGTPEQIYNEPANLFVAGFVGSPSMNLLEGALVDGTFTSNDMKVTGFRNMTHSAVMLGIRAEDVQVGPPEEADIVREVFSFELTGDATLVTVRVGTRLLTARATKEFRADVGDRVGITLRPPSCHLFDAKTQNRLHLSA